MKWNAEGKLMRAYLASLSDTDLQRKIAYRNTKGAPFENILWNLLAHLANHGTQTRAEAGIALTRYGQSPGDLDMILFFREMSK